MDRKIPSPGDNIFTSLRFRQNPVVITQAKKKMINVENGLIEELRCEPPHSVGGR